MAHFTHPHKKVKVFCKAPHYFPVPAAHILWSCMEEKVASTGLLHHSPAVQEVGERVWDGQNIGFPSTASLEGHTLFQIQS